MVKCLLVTCLLIAVTAATVTITEDEYKTEFLKLTSRLRRGGGGKAFGGRGSAVNSAARYRLFKDRYTEIQKINSEERSWTAGTNEFTLLTEDERKLFTGLNTTFRPRSVRGRVMNPVLEDNIPNAVDWLADGKVTEIKSQGNCGSCWAFAVVASVESHYAILTDNLKMMSEQQLLDCTYIDQGHDGCLGGWMSDAFVQIKNKLGNRLATSQSYQYTEVAASTCDTSVFDGNVVNALVEAEMADTTYTSVQYDDYQSYAPYEKNLAAAVSIGPVTVAIQVVNSMYSYESGTYDETDCMVQVNHAVTVVGYDQDTFNIKNSWGSAWGDNGYIKYDRSIQNQCFIGQWPEYPNMVTTESTEPPSENGDACDPNPCQNKGKCRYNDSVASGYYCNCKKKYTGTNCQEKINKCKDKSNRCPSDKNDSSCLAKKRFVRKKCQLSCGFCFL